VATRRAGRQSAASARTAVAAMFDYQQAGVFLATGNYIRMHIISVFISQVLF
jgi:hypothetical protein